jgi:hypothetical protein
MSPLFTCGKNWLYPAFTLQTRSVCATAWFPTSAKPVSAAAFIHPMVMTLQKLNQEIIAKHETVFGNLKKLLQVN